MFRATPFRWATVPESGILFQDRLAMEMPVRSASVRDNGPGAAPTKILDPNRILKSFLPP
jgi:hypothetical protein